LNEKVKEFEQEREKLRKEKVEQERLSKKLVKEMDEFKKQREIERAEFEEQKKQEVDKLKKEKLIFERQMRTLYSLPNRKEREEIEQLKNEIKKLNEELNGKTKQYKLCMDRAKKQIDDLTKKNSELQTEIRILEELRVKEMTSSKKSKKLKENVPPAVQHEAINTTSREQAKPIKAQSTLCTTGTQSDIIQDPSPTTNQSTIPIEYTIPKNNQVTHNLINEELDEEDTLDLLEDANYALVFPQKYHSKVSKLKNQSTTPDGKTIRIYEDGKTELILPNGTKKECHADGYSVIYFPNEDINQVFPDGRVIDYYHDTNTTKTTLPNGTKVYRLANGQIEKDFTDGAREVITPRGTVKCTFTDGGQEIIYTDGSIERIDRYGNKLRALDSIHNEV